MEVIAAYDFGTGGMGFNNRLPWHVPSDLEHFSHITTQAPSGMRNMVVMGRNTWTSIGCRPLPHRLNVVVSSTADLAPMKHMKVVRSLDAAVRVRAYDPTIFKIFVIGGARLFREALEHPHCHTAHITFIHKHGVKADVFFPVRTLNRYFSICKTSALQRDQRSGTYFSVMRYQRKNEYSPRTPHV